MRKGFRGSNRPINTQGHGERDDGENEESGRTDVEQCSSDLELKHSERNRIRFPSCAHLPDCSRVSELCLEAGSLFCFLILQRQFLTSCCFKINDLYDELQKLF